jgi:LuxR family maltose regulon positive regulatory protein
MNRPSTGGSLLATKLYLPAPRANAVTRARLVARLLSGLRTRLTLIAAPAGFGKSTLLAQALGEAHHLPARTEVRADRGSPATSPRIGWVALDAADNDPVRFWSYLCTAVERASPGAAASALTLLRAAPSDLEPAIAEMLNGLAEHANEVVLVLDDYHAITSPEVHESLCFLVDHAPPHLHLLIASRVDPPLPLARWRARGELVEIRAADLRFTTDEAHEFLVETMGLALDASAAAALDARTEGWAAGLQLAALSLQVQTDVGGFIETFSGSHRHVVDYLAEEVLQHQPAPVRTFLLQTSILERMNAGLCEAVVGHGSHLPAETILVELDRQNLFLIPLDNERRWYRYHHLFADLLRHRLGQEQPGGVAELHRRAARWFEQHGGIIDAVDHALAAEDTELVVHLLSAHGLGFVARGETQTLQRWLEALPQYQRLGNPSVCLVQAWLYLFNRQTVEMEPYLQAAEAALPASDGRMDASGLHGELLTLRAYVALERGAVSDAVTLAREAMVLLPAMERWARSSCGLVLGYALYVLGHTAEAAAVHAENVSLARAAGNAVSALFSATEVVKLLVVQGQLREARTRAEQAIAWAADEGWQQLSPASALHIWLGNILMEAGDLTGAEDELTHAIHLTRHGPGITAARAQLFLARLRQFQGDRDGATAALAVVEEICRSWEPGGERIFFDAHMARVRLLQGEVAQVRRWASTRLPWDPQETPSSFREVELLTLARLPVLDTTGSSRDALLPEALALLGWLRDQAVAGGRGAVVIETLALEALALARDGRPVEAHERLDEALTLAAPVGIVGLFLELGAPMADLVADSLTRRAPHDPLGAYRIRLLQAFATSQPKLAPRLPPWRQPEGVSPLVEALTEREWEVLVLLAAGQSGPRIAEHFVVSINTVKTQIKSIYSKLDAHSREDALKKARLLRLLP